MGPITCTIPCWITLSITVGIPRFLAPPFVLGISTLLIGYGLYSLLLCCHKPFCTLCSCYLWIVSFPIVLTLLCGLSLFCFHGFTLSGAVSPHLRFAIPAVRCSIGHTFDCKVTLVSPFRTLPTTASADFSQFVVTTANGTACETSRDKPASLSSSTCLIYAYGLRLLFGLRRLCSAHPSYKCLISGFCPSGYNFAIPSSRLYLTMQTLGFAMGFVGNYASMGFHHRLTACPSYLKRQGLTISKPCLK